MPLAVTLYSALTRVPGEIPVRVHVFDGGISEANRVRVEEVVRTARARAELKWHTLDSLQFEGLRVVRWLSSAAYLRLVIPEVLEEEEIVIYLDSDLLVRHDLSPLVREARRLQGFAISAVEDFWHADLGEVLGDQNCVALGVDPRAPYFNSGVLVIDVKKWRDMRIAERSLAFVRENAPIMRYHDQDALNVIFASQWCRLDSRWNVMLPTIQHFVARERSSGLERERLIDELAKGAYIFHFIGRHKPWGGSYEGPGRHEYHLAVRNAGWFKRNRELMFWRAKIGVSTTLWRTYRSLPDGIRGKIRSVSRQNESRDLRRGGSTA